MKIKELMPLTVVHGRTVYDEEREALDRPRKVHKMFLLSGVLPERRA